jgi:serine/threonine-protein kinase
VTTPQPTPRFTPPIPGESIQLNGRHYWLGARVGSGGFGEVYECTDEWQNPLVAKILIPQGRTYEQVRESWTHELNNLALLRHPYITFIHAAFEYRDTFYLVLERCNYTLKNLIAWPALDPAQWFVPVANCTLQALDYIHLQGYVHKDIHSGNVYVSHLPGVMPSAQPVTVFKIGDLGITRLEPQIDIFTTTLAQWMLPPEALRPTEFGAVARTVDIYHVALLLMSILLKTEPTFSEEQILAGEPRKMAERLSTPYSGALGRALRRHVAQRTQSAIDFWRDLRASSLGAGLSPPSP